MSFSSDIKEKLCSAEFVCPKCPAYEIAGALFFGGSVGDTEVKFSTENDTVAARIHADIKEAFGIDTQITRGVKTSRIDIADIYSVENIKGGMPSGAMPFACCRASYARGAFLGGGSVTDPVKGYHLEFDTRDRQSAEYLRGLKASYRAGSFKKQGKRTPGFRRELRAYADERLHMTLLTPPLLGICAFTLLPLVFMACMAFTNYSVLDKKLVLFDWVGLKNFERTLALNGSLGQTFWSVLGWTILWALAATFSNYILGMLLALFINWKEIRIKKFWRFCFVLTVAVPHFVTLLIMRQMLQPNGAVNVLLKELGWIDSPLPFFTDTSWARITVILINIWVGVPYTLLQITGILQSIPQEL